MPGGSTIHTHWEIVISFAGLKLASVIVGRHVPKAAHHVVDMLAQFPSAGTTSAGAEAKFVIRNETGPLVVLQVGSEGVAVDEASHGVSITISTMRVEFSSRVTFFNVDLSEVANAGDLDVVRGANEVNTFEGTIGNDTGASSALGTPGDFLTFRVADDAVRVGRGPEAEVVRVIDPGGLAFRRRGRATAAAVGSELSILGLAGKCIRTISEIPDLICVRSRARPDLHFVAVGEFTAGQVEAFAFACPLNMIVAEFCVSKLLIGIGGAA